jgi:hypothetical protein
MNSTTSNIPFTSKSKDFNSSIRNYLVPCLFPHLNENEGVFKNGIDIKVGHREINNKRLDEVTDDSEEEPFYCKIKYDLDYDQEDSEEEGTDCF